MYTYIIQEFSPIRHFYSISEQRNIYLIFQHLGRFKDRFNKNKQIQMTHALWCGNNDRCVLRVLHFGFSPPVHPPICRYVGTMSICILQLCVLIAKKKRKETAIAGIKLLTQVIWLRWWAGCFQFRKCHYSVLSPKQMLWLAAVPKEMLLVTEE